MHLLARIAPDLFKLLLLVRSEIELLKPGPWTGIVGLCARIELARPPRPTQLHARRKRQCHQNQEHDRFSKAHISARAAVVHGASSFRLVSSARYHAAAGVLSAP